VADQCLADDADALADLGGGAASERLVQDELVDALDLLTSELLGPAHPEPTLGGELLHEGASLRCVAELREVLAREVHDHRVVVLIEPLLDLLGEGLLGFGKLEIHSLLLRRSRRGTTRLRGPPGRRPRKARRIYTIRCV
jgi:hypothetical protein